MAQRTLFTMFRETVARHGDQPAVGVHSTRSAPYTYWTYRELEEQVLRCRRGLDALGLRRGDRVAILSENRPEWAVADLAAQSLGLITVAPYASVPAAQVAEIVSDSGARLLIVSDARQLAKVPDVRARCPELEFVLAMDGEAADLERFGAVLFSTVLDSVEATRSEGELDALSASVDPDSPATFIYTSGTTGEPKGAVLSHMNILQTPDAVFDEPIVSIGPGDTFLSFLPLSHITERVGGYYLPVRAGACVIYSLGLAALPDEITQTVRPTLMLSVPRLWENMYEKAKAGLAKRAESERKKVLWAVAVGTEMVTRRSEQKFISPVLHLKHIVAEKLILPKLRAKITGGRLRYCVSGGAPLDREAAQFFLGIGVQILEGYGLSETNIIAINRPGRQRIGTVGNLMLKTEVKIADDGEILTRGQGRMSGYYRHPVETAEAIDPDGWFHTGDIGELSADGYLKITDRKKDILVLTNGKKVAPQPIEALLKRSPFIGEAVLFGDRQPTVMAIVVPAFDKLKEWAREQGLTETEFEKLIQDPAVIRLFRSEIDRLTPELADYEKVKRFSLIDRSFSIESGELTPTLKVKRKTVAAKYADVLAKMER
jgi:long-chain acyl-CoA synthetase